MAQHAGSRPVLILFISVISLVSPQSPNNDCYQTMAANGCLGNYTEQLKLNQYTAIVPIWDEASLNTICQ